MSISGQAPRTPASHRGSDKTEPTQNSEPLLLDARRAAQMLSIAERTLWSLTKCDAIPSHRIGRRVLYRPAELSLWLDLGAPTEPGSAARVRVAARTGGAE
ncbi:MAG: helix-turn-helix domain-containing protein [Planctomycetota bacterium]